MAPSSHVAWKRTGVSALTLERAHFPFAQPSAERRYGSFERTIPLPMSVDADKAKAAFRKGVLQVTLPKTPEAQAQRKAIPVQAG